MGLEKPIPKFAWKRTAGKSHRGGEAQAGRPARLMPGRPSERRVPGAQPGATPEAVRGSPHTPEGAIGHATLRGDGGFPGGKSDIKFYVTLCLERGPD